MFNSVKLIRKNEQITTVWSGGKTTQLAIYPEDADYSHKNIIIKIYNQDNPTAIIVRTSIFH